MTRTAVACFLLLLVTESYAQRNDWVLTFNRSTKGSDMTLLKLQNDSLLVSKKGTLYSIPVSRITKLEYSEGNSNTARNILLGTVAGGVTGFFIGNFFDHQNQTGTDGYYPQATDNDYRWVLGGCGGLAGCFIGYASTSSNTKSYDVGDMDVNGKITVISSILENEGRTSQQSLVSQSKNGIHLKNGNVLKGIIIECLPDSLLKIKTADSSIFVTPLRSIDSVVEIISIAPSNTVFLKNGSMIKCSIVKLIPDSIMTIRSADSSFFTFRMNEIDRIELISTASQNISAKPTTAPTDSLSADHDKTSVARFGVFGGIVAPTGDFGSSGSSGGDASLGYCLGAEVNLGKSPVTWYTSVVLSENSVDKTKLGIPDGVNADIGSWTSFWILTGIRSTSQVSPEVRFYGSAQIGILFSGPPDITINGSGASFSETMTGSGAFAFGFGGGVIANDKINFGLRFYYSKPQLDAVINASTSSGYERITGSGDQSIACLMFTVGINF